MKKQDKLTQKQKDRYIHFEKLLKFYVELENRLKTSGRENFYILLAK